MKMRLNLSLFLISTALSPVALADITYPDGYYLEAEGLSGNALKDMLGVIAARGQKQLTYYSGVVCIERHQRRSE